MPWCLFMLCCLHDSCAPYILIIRRSYWMSWNLHLTFWTSENSQIAWILEVVLVLIFFMSLILLLTMCLQSLLICLLLTRKFTFSLFVSWALRCSLSLELYLLSSYARSRSDVYLVLSNYMKIRRPACIYLWLHLMKFVTVFNLSHIEELILDVAPFFFCPRPT